MHELPDIFLFVVQCTYVYVPRYLNINKLEVTFFNFRQMISKTTRQTQAKYTISTTYGDPGCQNYGLIKIKVICDLQLAFKISGSLHKR